MDHCLLSLYSLCRLFFNRLVRWAPRQYSEWRGTRQLSNLGTIYPNFVCLGGAFVAENSIHVYVLLVADVPALHDLALLPSFPGSFDKIDRYLPDPPISVEAATSIFSGSKVDNRQRSVVSAPIRKYGSFCNRERNSIGDGKTIQGQYWRLHESRARPVGGGSSTFP